MGVFDSIDPAWLSQEPSVDLYPLTFSPSCKDVWEKCVNEVKQDTGLTSYEDRWNVCISMFIDCCYGERREPFVEPAEVVNDTIFENVKAQYREAISWLQKVPCSVKETGKPKCFPTDTGFYIALQYKFSTKDRSFEEVLQHLGFKQVELGYEFIAPKGANILFQNIMDNPDSTSGAIRVTINSEKQPVIADNYVPSQSQLSSFILSVIFDSIKKTSNSLKEIFYE